MIVAKIKSLTLRDFKIPYTEGDSRCGNGDMSNQCMIIPEVSSESGSYQVRSIMSKPNVNVSQAVDEFSKLGSVTIYMPLERWRKYISNPPVCFSLRLWIASSGREGASSCNGGLPPLPVPDPISCTMNDIEIQHGTINLSDINGHQTSKSAFISCNGNGTGRVTVNVSAINNGVIILDNNGHLKSQIYVNGKAGGQSMTIPNNGSSINIMSKLTADTEFEFNGQFKKSSTIVLNIL